MHYYIKQKDDVSKGEEIYGSLKGMIEPQGNSWS